MEVSGTIERMFPGQPLSVWWSKGARRPGSCVIPLRRDELDPIRETMAVSLHACRRVGFSSCLIKLLPAADAGPVGTFASAAERSARRPTAVPRAHGNRKPCGRAPGRRSRSIVPCAPWFVLKIPGLPLVGASSRAARRNEASSVFDSRHARTQRFAQSMTTTRQMAPRAIAAQVTFAHQTWCGRSMVRWRSRYG